MSYLLPVNGRHHKVTRRAVFAVIYSCSPIQKNMGIAIGISSLSNVQAEVCVTDLNLSELIAASFHYIIKCEKVFAMNVNKISKCA